MQRVQFGKPGNFAEQVVEGEGSAEKSCGYGRKKLWMWTEKVVDVDGKSCGCGQKSCGCSHPYSPGRLRAVTTHLAFDPAGKAASCNTPTRLLGVFSTLADVCLCVLVCVFCVDEALPAGLPFFPAFSNGHASSWRRDISVALPSDNTRAGPTPAPHATVLSRM